MELSECLAALRKAGISKVTVTWDQEYDSDDICWNEDELSFFTKDNTEVTTTLSEQFGKVGDTATDLYEVEATLDSRFVDIYNQVISPVLEPDHGSYGTITLDCLSGNVAVALNKRVLTEQASHHTVPLEAEWDTKPTSNETAEPVKYLFAEPVCTCKSLMQGHDATCAFWIAKQSAK